MSGGQVTKGQMSRRGANDLDLIQTGETVQNSD